MYIHYKPHNTVIKIFTLNSYMCLKEIKRKKFHIYHFQYSSVPSVAPGPFGVFSLQSKNIPLTFLAGLLTNSCRFHLYKNGFVLPFFFLKTGSAVYRILGWQCCCSFGLVTFMYIIFTNFEHFFGHCFFQKNLCPILDLLVHFILSHRSLRPGSFFFSFSPPCPSI